MEKPITAQGHPYTISRRAIERGNLLIAETTLRAEIPRPSLIDLLDLIALIAKKDPRRHARVSARWLQRWLETQAEPIDEATFVTAALAALGGSGHDVAYTALVDMAKRASSANRWLVVTSEGPADGAESTRPYGESSTAPPGFFEKASDALVLEKVVAGSESWVP